MGETIVITSMDFLASVVIPTLLAVLIVAVLLRIDHALKKKEHKKIIEIVKNKK
jgi:uncharacterized membrane protein YkvI